MRYFDKKLNMLCFDGPDLEKLIKEPQVSQIFEELEKRGYSWDNLPTDKDEMRKIAYSMEMIKDKEDLEIFLALYSFLKFYPKDTKICFLLHHNADPNSIHSLEELKQSLKEDDITDFVFLTEQGLIAHQLKAYYGEISVDALFNHIKDVLLRKYGNDIGATNLLFFFKNSSELDNSLFIELNKKLNTLDIKGIGNILITYNEGGATDVMNTVYPKLSTSRIERKKFEEDLNTNS